MASKGPSVCAALLLLDVDALDASAPSSIGRDVDPCTTSKGVQVAGPSLFVVFIVVVVVPASVGRWAVAGGFVWRSSSF